jgi:hypothetical protein
VVDRIGEISMKRKENGFAATGILYTILLVFLVLMTTLLATLSSRSRILEKLKKDAKSESAEVKYKVYKNGTEIYYNPETGKKCTTAVSTPGTKSGCMKWYAFNDDDKSSTVNVILDHNTTARVAWNSTRSNSEMKEAANALETDTSNWKIDLNPRLIEANEVAKITGNTNFDANKENQDWFCFDTNQSDSTNWCSKAQGTSEYAWLFDYTNGCTSYGCNKADSSTWGYWTSSPYKGNSVRAWLVNRVGDLTDGNVADTFGGVRPVITISKSNIS